VYGHTLPDRLGIGFSYQHGLLPAIEAAQDLIDFFEVSPDVLCRERITANERRLEYDPELLNEAIESIEGYPVVIHGIGLSIGSVSGWNEEYIRILDEFHSLRSFDWHSEHLGFMLMEDSDGKIVNIGVPLPLPYTEEALDLLVPRCKELCKRYKVPFLLENLTYYLPNLPFDKGYDEIEFLNQLTERSGCGLLLDLHNLYCNSINFNFDPIEGLSRLRLDKVIQIHLAGGTYHDGFMMDIHSDFVPEKVWEMLDYVLPHTNNLGGIVYELLDQALPIVGIEGIYQQIERTKLAWEKHYTKNIEKVTYATR
jgi:uncharacterized protein